jgi:hypothetical protein
MFDADASTYIEAVEAADTQTLETPVRYAINDFVIGCKQDGIWNAIKASCILAGARTLTGALVPLVGAVPNRFGTESGWGYSRKTGLIGNGTNNYINSNRASNVDPQDDTHISLWVSVNGTALIGGSTNFSRRINGDTVRLNNSTSFNYAPATPSFVGASRADSATYNLRFNKNSVLVSASSVSPGNTSTVLFAVDNSGVVSVFSAARLAFYSIGESLDLALLDARVTDLINTFARVIS